MSRTVLALYVLLAAVCLTVPACGSNEDLPTTPTAPTAPTITERFEDTIGANHARTHSFSSGSGSIVVTLASIAPESTTSLSVSLGIWNGSTCSLQITNDAAGRQGTVIGQASSSGSFCVRVSDNGGVTEPTTYVVEVVHRE